jgi:hypothetical protein
MLNLAESDADYQDARRFELIFRQDPKKSALICVHQANLRAICRQIEHC